MGKGVYRNYYKGHMDKIKGESGGGGGRWVRMGWGGVEGWGENADNCNCITIKFFFKRLSSSLLVWGFPSWPHLPSPQVTLTSARIYIWRARPQAETYSIVVGAVHTFLFSVNFLSSVVLVHASTGICTERGEYGPGPFVLPIIV